VEVGAALTKGSDAYSLVPRNIGLIFPTISANAVRVAARWPCRGVRRSEMTCRSWVIERRQVVAGLGRGCRPVCGTAVCVVPQRTRDPTHRTPPEVGAKVLGLGPLMRHSTPRGAKSGCCAGYVGQHGCPRPRPNLSSFALRFERMATDTGHELGHGMFDVHARVNFDEVESLRVQDLERPVVAIIRLQGTLWRAFRPWLRCLAVKTGAGAFDELLDGGADGNSRANHR